MVSVKQYLIKLKNLLQYNYVYYILIIITMIYSGLYIKNYIPPNKYNINDNNFILTIKEYKIDGNKLSIEFKENLIGTYYFEKEKDKNNFKYQINDKVYIKGKLKSPNNNTITNTFNYKKYLYHKGITYLIEIEKISLKETNKNIFYKLKNRIYERINNINHNEYIYAFILGKKEYIKSDIYNNYKINTITHLFSLSALHVSVLSSMILCLLNKFKLKKEISLLIIFILLLFFLFLTSYPPSLLRATIFFLLSEINKMYKLKIKNLNLLYITLMLLLIINPNYIYNTGFILSFTITFFLLIYSQKYKIKNKLLNIFITSIISMLASFPIIINMNYEINIIGFINNIFFIPFISYCVFPISIISIIIPKLSFLLNILIIVMETISNLSSKIINCNLIFQRINFIEIIIYYSLLLTILLKQKNILIFFLIVVYLYIKPSFNKNIQINYLDMSQGDSSLIITKNNKNILIDTGGKIKYKSENWEIQSKEYNTTLSKIIPYFKSIGMKKIDYLILTHGDYDHMGEAINLVENFKVEKVIFNCGEFNELEQELIKVLDKKKIPYYRCIKELYIDDNKLYFLNNKDYGNENDNSSVIYTKLNNQKFLFMGDAGVEVEKDLMEKYNLQDIDVLKVGHHGSKTSSSIEFIDEINPKYSIISVGKNNRYGHPNKEVLDNLNDSNIYRTDIDGSIMFKIKNNKLKIETCSP